MFTSPTSFRLNSGGMDISLLASQDGYGIFKADKPPPHSSHPDFGHLTLLVFEAVMEVVFVIPIERRQASGSRYYSCYILHSDLGLLALFAVDVFHLQV